MHKERCIRSPQRDKVRIQNVNGPTPVGLQYTWCATGFTFLRTGIPTLTGKGAHKCTCSKVFARRVSCTCNPGITMQTFVYTVRCTFPRGSNSGTSRMHTKTTIRCNYPVHKYVLCAVAAGVCCFKRLMLTCTASARGQYV